MVSCRSGWSIKRQVMVLDNLDGLLRKVMVLDDLDGLLRQDWC